MQLLGMLKNITSTWEQIWKKKKQHLLLAAWPTRLSELFFFNWMFLYLVFTHNVNFTNCSLMLVLNSPNIWRHKTSVNWWLFFFFPTVSEVLILIIIEKSTGEVSQWFIWSTLFLLRHTQRKFRTVQVKTLFKRYFHQTELS